MSLPPASAAQKLIHFTFSLLLQIPVPLTEEEMASLGFMKEDVLVDFTLGDMVTVISGAWKDTVGAIKAINESKQTITINVEMFGRETPVELGFAEVKKM